MINLTKHSVNGKISVKSLVKTFDEYQAKENVPSARCISPTGGIY